MGIEIILGVIIGTVTSIVVGVWATNKQAALQGEKETILDESITPAQEYTVPIEKRLRDIIYDCERNISACKNQINSICKDQLDLLQDVGKKSYVEVKNKALFFEYYNPTTLDRHFYYERDLSKTMAPDVLANTKKIVQKYSDHISLTLMQQELFEKLIVSHKENLDRISGVKNQNAQVKKVSLHKNKLAELDGENKLEEQAIYNELMITDIQEELEHQEECLRQYIELNQKYENPFDQNVEKKFEQQIKIIINQLEKEDPINPK
jgi:hypothetical protein